jgi:hypothetical protein
MEQALEVMHRQGDVGVDEWIAAEKALRAALAETSEPVAFTPREIELIDGMIGAQLYHAQRCDGIANRTMAEKQKAWDMERVALLQKIKAAPQPPAPAVDYKPLTDPHDHPEPHSYKWTQSEMDYINKRVEAALQSLHAEVEAMRADVQRVVQYEQKLKAWAKEGESIMLEAGIGFRFGQLWADRPWRNK